MPDAEALPTRQRKAYYRRGSPEFAADLRESGGRRSGSKVRQFYTLRCDAVSRMDVVRHDERSLAP